MIARRLLLLVAFAGLVPLRAQYEQLIANPEPLNPPAAVVAPVAPAAPSPPRLLSPALHREKILHLDHSPDGRHLVTLDAKVLKIWDVAERAAIVTHSLADLTQTEDFRAAWFTAKPRQLVVCTSKRMWLIDDFDFSKPTADVYADSQTQFAFNVATQTLFSATFHETQRRIGLRRFDAASAKAEHIGVVDLSAEKLALTGGRVWPGWPQAFTVDASGHTAAFRLQAVNPVFVIDLKDAAILARVAPDKNALGLLPDGRVLTRATTGTRHVFSVLDSPAPLFEVESSVTPNVRLPTRADAPILVTAANTTWLHDLASGKTSAAFRNPGRYSDAVITVGARPLLAQSSYNPATNETVATHLDFFDPAAGVLRASWSEPTFIADALYARADDFDFVVRNNRAARRVRLTEAGIVVEPLDYLATALDQAHALYDEADGHWLLLGSTQPRLGAPDPAAPGKYRITPLGAESHREEALEDKTLNLNRTRFFDRSRDGRVLALYHGNAITVVDLPARRRLALFPIEDALVRDAARQRIALSPDGTTVAYSYIAKDGDKWSERLECRDVSTGELKWTHLRANDDGRIDHLKFSADGRQLFLTGARFESLFASTGERAGWLGNHGQPLAYNRAGTLVAQVSATTLKVSTLPDAKVTKTLRLPVAPDAITFVGSDRFLLFTSTTDESLRLVDLAEPAVVAVIDLFESPRKWLVRHPATGLFSSETSLQDVLKFAQGEQLFPLAAYFDEFYRPRLLGSLIKGLAPRPSVPLSDLSLAPKLTLSIDGPATRGLTVEDEFETFELPAASVTLRLDATGEGAPITDLRLYHNGKLVAGATRGLTVEDDEDAPPAETFKKTATHTFALTPGKNRFRAVAINAQGTESAPDELVVFSQAAPPADETGVALHVVTVGLNAYRNPEYNLNYARADADAVEAALRARLAPLFARAAFYSLRDADATRENLLATLDTVKREAGPRDVFVFYYAGHGVMSVGDEDPEFYLAPHEITQLYGERRVLRRLAIPGRDLLAYSRDIAAQKQLFILDACQSAGALKDVAVRGAVEERAIAQLARSTGTHWLTATGSEQFATEFAKLGHGAFTRVLLDGLGGAADVGDGVVTVNELKAYLEAKVPELTAAEKGAPQYPVTYGYGQDFPLGVVAK
jgi:hypothetical protein